MRSYGPPSALRHPAPSHSPPRLIALLPYLFYYSLFAMIAAMLLIGLWAWSTLSAGGSQGGGYSPECLEEAFSELQIQSAA